MQASYKLTMTVGCVWWVGNGRGGFQPQHRYVEVPVQAQSKAIQGKIVIVTSEGIRLLGLLFKS